MSEAQWFDDEKSRISPDEFLKEFEELKRQQSMRVQFDRFWCSLYYDRAYQGFSDGRDWAEIFVDLLDSSSGRLNENVILRIVATLSAKFAKQRSKPQTLTTLGDWALQRRADRYTRLMEGVLHESKFYERQRRSDLHDIICGTGGIIVLSRDDKVRIESVPPWETYVNVADSREMEPTILYRRKLVPRRRLMRVHPKHADAIERAQSVESKEAFDSFGSYDADVIEVVTGWHLPSEEDADDGRMMVAIPGVKLVDEEWDRPRFPISFSRYMLPPDGFYGIGVVSQLVGMQYELNRTLANNQTALEMCSAPFVAIERGSSIVESHMSDQIGRIVEYTGTAPTIVAPGVLHPEQMQHRDRVKSSMFQNSGVSELAASSMKPAGLNSGKAIRTYAEMTDEAFHDALLRKDQQTLDVAECILDEIESIAKSGGTYKTKYVGPFGIETIKYSDVKMDRDSMYLKIQGVSALSSTVSGRIQDVLDLQDSGENFSPEQRRRLLNIPDLSADDEFNNSMENLLRQLVEEEMLGEGKWTTPEPRWDLQLALDIVSKTILMAQVRKAPADRIELLRKFEVECMRLWNEANPPPEPAAPMAPAGVLPAENIEIDPNMPAAMPSPIAGGEMPAGPKMGQMAMQ